MLNVKYISIERRLAFLQSLWQCILLQSSSLLQQSELSMRIFTNNNLLFCWPHTSCFWSPRGNVELRVIWVWKLSPNISPLSCKRSFDVVGCAGCACAAWVTSSSFCCCWGGGRLVALGWFVGGFKAGGAAWLADEGEVIPFFFFYNVKSCW